MRMNDDEFLFGLGCFGLAIVGTVALSILGVILYFSLNYLGLIFDTSQQNLRRTNINNQAETQIANNAYFHTLLGQIKTDKEDLVQAKSELKTFLVTHDMKKIDCNSVEGYNDCQEYQNLEGNKTSAEGALVNNVDEYNAAANNTDYQHGLDRNLPRHVNKDGNY
jgi:hypothetical protein